MIIFRPHRGGFEESMSEAKVFSTELNMKKYIVDKWNYTFKGRSPFDLEDIVIPKQPEAYDDRNGWKDTRYVCVKRMFDEVYDHPQCIGMCATVLDRKSVV